MPIPNQFPSISSPFHPPTTAGFAAKTLGPLDATLPPSLDSNSLSYFARHGPVAASVPSRFGRSLGSSASPYTHTSLFIHSDKARDLPSGRAPGSPRNSSAFAHDRHRQSILSRPAAVSSSFPARGWPANNSADEAVDDDIEFALEEEFVPTSLHEDVFSPQERQRRLSRHGQRESMEREARNALYSPPVELSSSSGSIPRGTPPSSSRFGALFSSRYSKDDLVSPNSGHVASPLRRSVDLVSLHTSQRILDFDPTPDSRPPDFLYVPPVTATHNQKSSVASIHPDDDTTFFMDDPDESLVTAEMHKVLI
ncbi:hypothetical protein NEOLI_002608 [Neolecta irregularis DAH-3]|uniref:Uncharacterized protein n=1 Tax=Neolecta irregularis (strain DAH-3) TaxID=1198029 RepID=A0A1U7LRR2_NEOID|nr:hypothetical protein NEOLI_002608 [Neolecta irregularis DAH-3]|eukprot:OLL25355.1 hypothetical protein NEOLI_002608 [Neolecta irregularis DAH-3]